MSEYLTFATANTHMGRLFKVRGGLDPLADSEAIGFQEVHPDRDPVEKRLSEDTDLVLAYAAPEFGLAIAVHKYLKVSNRHKAVLQERGNIGQRLMNLEARYKAAFRTRARGIQGLAIHTSVGQSVHFANAHPIIPFKPRQRGRQIRTIPIALAHVGGPLVLVQDGNHCPGPRPVDRAMRYALDMKSVDIGDEPTYVLERSKHAWLGVMPAFWTLQFDDILYRGLREVHTEVVDIDSDHRAIKTTLAI
jgi:hypothetical protein